MTDVESRQPVGRNARAGLNNPYATGSPLPVRSRYHPLNILQRGMWMSLSIWIFHRMDAYNTIMTSPNIRHEWFKIGLATSIALLLLKAYVEIYTGRIQKKEVNYQTIPQLTHAAIILICLSSVAFHIALWPVYGGQSMFLMFVVGVFLTNFCLMFPTIVQNLVALVALTFFLQEYQ